MGAAFACRPGTAPIPNMASQSPASSLLPESCLLSLHGAGGLPRGNGAQASSSKARHHRRRAYLRPSGVPSLAPPR